MILTHPEFWKTLKLSGSVNESRGMTCHEFISPNGKLTTFSKTHSYGEYIFDWSWAQAYERSGLPYYPKLTSMVPFTPATAPHFLAPQAEWKNLLDQHDELLQTHHSAHFLFTTIEENKFLQGEGYILRDSFQYHFFNEGYAGFEDFLKSLKTKKAKNLRKERDFPGIVIERLTGKGLVPEMAQEMYEFYLMTLEEKQAIPYLTREFFRLLFAQLSGNILYVRAKENESVIAGALFYYDSDRLYGRYWGARKLIANLHFELCYYQGIDFCLEKKLQVFEAGAQGEHKITRGFRPVLTTSAHKINHPGFARLISEFIHAEKADVRKTIEELTSWLPFKH
jgi:predicted N-acyltransferase